MLLVTSAVHAPHTMADWCIW